MTLHALLQAAISPENAKPIVEGVLAVVVGLVGYANKRGDSKTRTVVTDAITAHQKASQERFGEIAHSISDLRGIVIGVDGKNGMRGDLAELKTDVKDVRETLTEMRIDTGKMDVRITKSREDIDGLEKRERER